MDEAVEISGGDGNDAETLGTPEAFDIVGESPAEARRYGWRKRWRVARMFPQRSNLQHQIEPRGHKILEMKIRRLAWTRRKQSDTLLNYPDMKVSEKVDRASRDEEKRAARRNDAARLAGFFMSKINDEGPYNRAILA